MVIQLGHKNCGSNGAVRNDGKTARLTIPTIAQNPACQPSLFSLVLYPFFFSIFLFSFLYETIIE